MRNGLIRSGAVRAAHCALVVAALVPALVLTTLRLVEPSAGPAVRMIAFTPFGLPLYLLVALLVVVPAWRRWWARAVLVLAIGGASIHALWWSPMFLGDRPQAPADAVDLTVMTSNLYVGAGDAAAVVQAVGQHDVDLLVLEEITIPDLTALDQAGLGRLLPYRIGEARPPGDTSGTMVFSTSPIEDPVGLDTEMQTWQARVDGLTVLGVHPVSPEAPQVWRHEQTLIREAATRSDADLIIGDFNATLDHQPLQELQSDGWRDAAETANAGWQPTWPANGEFRLGGVIPLPPLVAIDHVFVGSRVVPLATATVDIPGTDHRALIAHLACGTGS